MPQKLVFPVLGAVTYGDDFGQPRPGGTHQGIDIMATKRSLALAVEAGKVEFWKSSASAGCMLYLHGASGTDYYYIHLNNDLSAKNDNRGKCVAGTAYAKGLKNGAKVMAGQPVGFVGDSGDANGLHAHLHFELHPGRGAAVDAYPWLQRATHLLFSAPRGSPFTLELRGTIVSVSEDTVQVRLATVSAWPMRQHQTQLKRGVLVSVPADATRAEGAETRSPRNADDARLGEAEAAGGHLDGNRADDAEGAARRRPRAQRLARLARRSLTPPLR